MKFGITVNIQEASEQRNSGTVSCSPGLEGITPNLLRYIAEKATSMSRTQDLRHADQSWTKEKQELGHAHEPPSSCKDFLDEALIIWYDGSNTPYVIFKKLK